jgi:hypothetical protein
LVIFNQQISKDAFDITVVVVKMDKTAPAFYLHAVIFIVVKVNAFPGMIQHISVEADDTGLMVFTFEFLPKNKRVLSTGAYHQSESEGKTNSSLRHLEEAKTEVEWAYALSLLSLLESKATMVFLFFFCRVLPASNVYLCGLLFVRRERRSQKGGKVVVIIAE